MGGCRQRMPGRSKMDVALEDTGLGLLRLLGFRVWGLGFRARV